MDDKSIAEKFTDAIGKATDSVKNTMSHIVETASVAAQHAMESNAERMSGQASAEGDIGKLAGTATEPVDIPLATDTASMSAPPIFAQPAPKKTNGSPGADRDRARHSQRPRPSSLEDRR